MLYATAWQVQLFDLLILVAIIVMIVIFTVMYLMQRKENKLLREQNDHLRELLESELDEKDPPAHPLPMPRFPPMEPPIRVVHFKKGEEPEWVKRLFSDDLPEEPPETLPNAEDAIKFVEDFFKPEQ